MRRYIGAGHQGKANSGCGADTAPRRARCASVLFWIDALPSTIDKACADGKGEGKIFVARWKSEGFAQYHARRSNLDVIPRTQWRSRCLCFEETTRCCTWQPVCRKSGVVGCQV